MDCPHCGASISKKAERCDYCGAYIDQESTPKLQNSETYNNYNSDYQRKMEDERRRNNSAKQAKVIVAIVFGFVVLITFFIVILTVVSTALIAKHGVKNASYSGQIHIGSNQDIASMEELKVEITDIDPITKRMDFIFGYNQYKRIVVVDDSLFDYMRDYDIGTTKMEGQKAIVSLNASCEVTKIAPYFSPFLLTEELEDGSLVVVKINSKAKKPEYMVISGDATLSYNKAYKGGVLYPSMEPWSITEEGYGGVVGLNYTCEEKKIEKCAVNHLATEQVDSYWIKANNKWYVTNRLIYDRVQPGDSLEQYAILDEVEKTSFILEETQW